MAWHAATTKTTPLVLTPLRIALWDRGRSGHPVRPGELIAHSDVGSQYTSLRFAEHLAAEGIAASIGTVADAYDCQSLSTRFRKDWGVPADAV